ncbi:phosphotransferase family protein [Salicibibacter cibi]|uniref:Phosphotransferase family protein n=1 Tax=Salicibibacter cibi TaxID=2743001 RepID=A0A7T6ZCW7_9BACI|nr:phosphotransferase family protein [Salicibibacter cibi]QQK81195.1 phosphotransferase family protein [Salicibibacter cibi]
MEFLDTHKKGKRKKWLENLLGRDWELETAGGSTGEAFSAKDGEQKLFLKCNSSPFLAVLSAEGIVPKLLWTKRIANGDVITAQRWVNGRKLKPMEMKQPEVAALLGRIHRSTELLDMLKRIEAEVMTPEVLLQRLCTYSLHADQQSPILFKAFEFLKARKSAVYYDNFVVCHCDMNHNNWIMDEEEGLFLVDWDGASVADPALDLSILLYWYVPKQEWHEWLEAYELDLNDQLLGRMHWYIIWHTLEWMLSKGIYEDSGHVQVWLRYLNGLVEDDERRIARLED